MLREFISEFLLYSYIGFWKEFTTFGAMLRWDNFLGAIAIFFSPLFVIEKCFIPSDIGLQFYPYMASHCFLFFQPIIFRNDKIALLQPLGGGWS
jgi:hypothetical protein